eukprot:TRINITY_DN18325_c0_g1_i1.p1 TRINITY_DN18325_c0_g1~~TRINITY_DN18325_c0_g1_i1.p1  ORF type:complete len:453 (+),score=43.57 TRINITY_DN18325_c0_g1_i1:783-2141(+)
MFLFGQRFAAFCRRPGSVFLDKLCIHQTDEEKKSAGVLALGMFLRHSERLVCLWSPRYFCRLWCAYEWATWLYLGRDLTSTALMVPVGLGQAYILWMLLLCWYLAGGILNVFGNVWYFVSVVSATLLCLGVAYTWMWLSLDLLHLDEQLKDFSIQRASCFCCANGHVDPTNLVPIPCDRELVYSSLETWFADRDGKKWDRQQHLEAYNEAIRTEVRNCFRAKSRGFGSVRYRDVLALASPLLWNMSDNVPGMMSVDPKLAFFWLLNYLHVYAIGMPLLLAFAGWLSLQLSRRRCRNVLCDALQVLFVAVLLLTSCLPMWYLGVKLVEQGTLLGQALYYAVLILLTMYAYRNPGEATSTLVTKTGVRRLQSSMYGMAGVFTGPPNTVCTTPTDRSTTSSVVSIQAVYTKQETVVKQVSDEPSEDKEPASETDVGFDSSSTHADSVADSELVSV